MKHLMTAFVFRDGVPRELHGSRDAAQAEMSGARAAASYLSAVHRVAGPWAMAWWACTSPCLKDKQTAHMQPMSSWMGAEPRVKQSLWLQLT